MEEYQLEKWIWTESDFESMGWHDATIHSLRLESDLTLDIDYIFQWDQPKIEGIPFTFWVAPSTLIFESPTQLTFELNQETEWGVEISDIELELRDQEKYWTIITTNGNISFKAASFKQIVRRAPSFQYSQSIPDDERGGISFESTPGNKAVSELKPEVLERRTKEQELYESAKNRRLLNAELKKLSESRDSEQVQTKDFIIQKNELKTRINALNAVLHGTRFESW